MLHGQNRYTDYYRLRLEVMGKYLWMMVEADKYELPLVIADSARELAEKCGTTTGNVEACVARGCQGVLAKRKFVKVLKDE